MVVTVIGFFPSHCTYYATWFIALNLTPMPVGKKVADETLVDKTSYKMSSVLAHVGRVFWQPFLKVHCCFAQASSNTLCAFDVCQYGNVPFEIIKFISTALLIFIYP